jgi:hypothetical protein
LIRPPHRMAFALVAAFFISAQTLGQAQSEGNEARDLMKKAQAAKAAGDHATALLLASRAGEIRMTPAVRLFIAEEQAEVGDIVGAMSSAEACAHEAAESKLPDRINIVRSCRALLGRLQQFAARVVVTLPVPPPPQIEITVNGKVLPESLYGQPYFLEPGPVRVEAKAPGHHPFQADTVIPLGEERTVAISLERDFGPEPPPSEFAEKPMPKVVASQRSSSAGPYIVLGAGALSFGASVLFLVLRNNSISDLEKQCGGPNNTVCQDTPETRSLHSKISTYNTLTNVSLIVGGAAALGGTLWLVLDKTASVGNTHAQLQIAPRNGGAEVGVAGAF